MARRTDSDRLLPANIKTIQRIVRLGGRNGSGVAEYRIEGVRGLVLHVMPGGTATWYFHYDVEAGVVRKRRKLKIGRFDDISLAAALAEAERLRPAVRGGADPVTRKAIDRTALTFADLAAERFAKGDPLRQGTAYDYQLILKRDILPMIGPLPAKDVTREHVIGVLDHISMRGASRRADTTRAVISSIFSFAVDRGIVAQNPATGLKNRHDYQPRDVVASHQDIRRLWSAMDSDEAAMSSTMATIVRLALLTGQRRTEIAAARIADLDLNSGSPSLTIPRGRAKNRQAHRVPLSPQAAALFAGAVVETGGSKFVFPGLIHDAPIGSRSVSKAMERARAKLQIADITMHDLRRTAGSYMGQLGVPKEIRERVLNHAGSRQGSVTEAVYNWHDYDAEKRAALELWADAVDCIVRDVPAEIDSYAERLARTKGTSKVRIGGLIDMARRP